MLVQLTSDVIQQQSGCRYDLPEDRIRQHVQRMLGLVNLEGFADRQTNTLSGGQKQRVAIAGALAQCPKVLPACVGKRMLK